MAEMISLVFEMYIVLAEILLLSGLLCIILQLKSLGNNLWRFTNTKGYHYYIACFLSPNRTKSDVDGR